MAKKKEKKRAGETTILDRLKKNADDKWILPLEAPFKFGKREVKELLLLEPKAKHLRSLSSDPTMDDILKIIADLCGEPDSLIDELDMIDTNNASEYFGAFG